MDKKVRRMFIVKMDLHTHSIFSDGSDTPVELIKKAKEEGITCLAITDHDTIKGNISDSDIEMIFGVEFSILTKHGREHILGYDFDLNNKEILSLVAKIDKYSRRNSELYLYYLQKQFGIYFPEEEINNLLTKNKNIGRPDLAKLCCKYKFARSIDEAFILYLKEVLELARPYKKGVTEEEVLATIKKANGLSSLAHLVSLDLSYEELNNKIKRLKEMGLNALECQHYKHDLQTRKQIQDFIKKYDFLESGGTDYHGISKPYVQLGYGKNFNVNIDTLSIVDEIRCRHQKNKVKTFSNNQRPK